MALPVFCINRACDTEDWARFRRKAKAVGVEPIRIPAIDGHRAGAPFALYADLIGESFWGKSTAKPGALACFLSHRRAWETLLRSCAEAALICEDDVDLLAPPVAPEADLVFANDRMAGEARNVASALVALTAKAPGADCYLLSRAGAERLLDLTARQKIQCGVDWALVWNALDTRESLMRDELRVLARLLPPGPAMINAAVLDRPLARLRPAPSRIDHSTTRPLTELIGQEALLAHTEFVSLIRLGPASLRFAGRSGPDPVMEAHRRGELWEADALAALIQRFPEGGSFLDIGAHLGNHTVALGCLSAAQVIAVEPNPEITRLWRLNAGLNGIDAELCPVALGAQESPGTLTIRRRMPGNSQVRAGVAPKSDDLSEPTHSVEIIPGDDLVGTRRIDAIKIDTSGREADVLRGLKRVLWRDRPLVLIEHRQDEADRIGQLLARSGLGVAEEFPAAKPARRLSLFTPDGR